MRRIPWRLSLRYSRKGAITVLGIALGISFSLVSFSIVEGLERDTLGIGRNHPDTAVIVTDALGAGLAAHWLERHPRLVGVATGDGVDADGRRILAIALVGGDAPFVAPDEVRPEGASSIASPARVGAATLQAGPRVQHALLPEGWALVPADVLPRGAASLDHGILLDPTPAELEALRDDGLAITGAPALQGFFRASGAEIARDLLLVVAFSSTLAALFCYEFLRSEVRESHREIGIWRSVGMRTKDVVALFLARAAAIGAVALAIGWALSLLLLGYAYQRTGNEPLRFALDPVAMVLLPLVFLATTVAGGVVPAVLAGRVSVQRALESEP